MKLNELTTFSHVKNDLIVSDCRRVEPLQEIAKVSVVHYLGTCTAAAYHQVEFSRGKSSIPPLSFGAAESAEFPSLSSQFLMETIMMKIC